MEADLKQEAVMILKELIIQNIREEIKGFKTFSFAGGP